MDLSWKLWPPSDETRALVVQRIASNLLCFPWGSQKHEALPEAEADAAEKAKSIEEVAFMAAQKEADAWEHNGGGGKGSSLVALYAKEASKAALEFLKHARKGLIRAKADSVRIDQAAEKNSVSVVESVKECESDAKEEEAFDLSSGERRMLQKSDAEKLFNPLKNRSRGVSRVCLSNQSFGVEAAAVAAQCLSASKATLVDADLSDIVAGRHEEEALQVMRILSEALEGFDLEALNLSDNALGEKGIRAFSALLQSQNHLKKLLFRNNGISVEAAEAICELLPSGKDLATLHFHNNMSGDGGAEALCPLIKSATLLEDFRFSSSRVAEAGAVALAKALCSGRSLKRIDLRDNMFGPEGGVELAVTLRQHQWLTEVFLSDLGLEDDGAMRVLEALQNGAPGLKILDLGGNEITEAAASFIASCIKEKQELIKLGLGENELKDKGCIIVSRALIDGHEKLRELDLSVNELGRKGAVAAAEAIANKTDFKFLNLNGNQISKIGLDALRELLAKGCNGVNILGPLDDNEEGSEHGEEDDQSGSEHEDNQLNEDKEEGENLDEEGLDSRLGSLAVVD